MRATYTLLHHQMQIASFASARRTIIASQAKSITSFGMICRFSLIHGGTLNGAKSDVDIAANSWRGASSAGHVAAPMDTRNKRKATNDQTLSHHADDRDMTTFFVSAVVLFVALTCWAEQRENRRINRAVAKRAIRKERQ